MNRAFRCINQIKTMGIFCAVMPFFTYTTIVIQKKGNQGPVAPTTVDFSLAPVMAECGGRLFFGAQVADPVDLKRLAERAEAKKQKELEKKQAKENGGKKSVKKKEKPKEKPKEKLTKKSSTIDSAAQSADEEKRSREYALCALSTSTPYFVPIAPEEVTLAGEQEADNPLYGAGIAHLATVGTTSDLTYMNKVQGQEAVASLAVVTRQEPCHVYLLENHNGHVVHVAKDLTDACGYKTKQIIKLVGTFGNRPFVAAVVTNKDGNFGVPGSGIAIINVTKRVAGTGVTKEFVFEQINVQQSVLVKDPLEKEVLHDAPEVAAVSQVLTELSDQQADIMGDASPTVAPQKPEEPSAIRAFPLDITTAAAKIQSDLASMGSVVDMYWDPEICRLYIALQVTAASQDGAGARALLVGRFTDNGQMQLLPCAPDAFFVGDNQIVGARGAGQTVSLHSVQTLWTSTKLPYLVVVGGNGAGQDTANHVYALPLTIVRHTDKGTLYETWEQHGIIAAKQSAPREVRPQGPRAQAVSRVFEKPAETAADGYTSELMSKNAPVLVGGGPLQAGVIQKVIIHQDAIYAVVIHNKEGDEPGVYHSQALLKADGSINGWTRWRRHCHLDDSASLVAMDRTLGSVICMRDSEKGDCDTVTMSFWDSALPTGRVVQLNQALQAVLPQEYGGVQGLFEFSAEVTPGLGDSSLLVATGFGTVAIVETNHNDPVVAQQLRKDAAPMLVFNGDLLKALGAITQAEVILHPDSNKGSLLVIGSSKGLAVLCDQMGNGWQSGERLHSVSQERGLTFKIVGDYRSIERLLFDEHFLYVLTSKELTRIDVREPHWVGVPIVERSLFGARCVFTDMVVSHGCIALATSHGLFKNDREGAWQAIEIPGNLKMVTGLSSVSITGRCQDLVSEWGGMLHVLTGSHALNCSHLSRYAVIETAHGFDIELIRDNVNAGGPQPFLNFNTFRTYCVTDGSRYFHAADRNDTLDPLLMTGSIKGARRIPLDLTKASHMTGALFSRALGSWLIAGDFGIKGNE